MTNLNHQNLFDYLASINICSNQDLQSAIIDISCSRNYHWVIDFKTINRKLIIKHQPNFQVLDNDNRLSQEVDIIKFIQSESKLLHSLSLVPKILHIDKSNSIVIYELSYRYTTLKNYYDKNPGFAQNISSLIGKRLAIFHSETINNDHIFIDQFPKQALSFQLDFPDYISHYLINRIQPESLYKMPYESWRLIGIIQDSDNLRSILSELIYSKHCYCLTHNNLGFDKILVDQDCHQVLSETENHETSLIKIIDWESASWGDPACDLGSVIAGFFKIWLDSAIVDDAIEPINSLNLAEISFKEVYPAIIHTIKAYLESYPKILEKYPEFIHRVIQFAGLSLLHQTLTQVQLAKDDAFDYHWVYFHLFSKLLCYPEKFISQSNISVLV
jgi:hypothetical protein